MLMIGLSTGSIIHLSSHRPTFYAVVLPCMGSLIAALLLHGGSLALTVAVLGLVSLYATVTGSATLYKSMQRQLELRFENRRLLDEAVERELKLERANAAKTRFLAAASHDLRQPVHALGAFLQPVIPAPASRGRRFG